MNLSPDVLPRPESVDAPGLAFVPSDRPDADVHRADAEIPEAKDPLLNMADDRKVAERSGRVEVPIAELRLLASHSGAGEHGSAQHTSRLRLGLLIAGLVAVAALLGWQRRGDEVKQMASSSLASLWPAALVNPSRVAPDGSQAIVPSQVNAAGASEQALAQAAPAESAGELQQQLQSITHELAAMKQNLEQLAAQQTQLAAKQEQMARDIAALGAAKQDDKPNTTSARPQRSATLPPPPRKKPPALLPPPGPRPLSPEQASAPLPQQDVAVRPPPPPQDIMVRPPPPQDVVVRPPMPLRQD
jgi:hypothetical protein